jgi:FtsP/CotA-like multicopper oxidase with cupredoxin domain
MSTGLGPYVGEDAIDSDNTGLPGIAIETTLIASRVTGIDIGGGVLANAEVFNGKIPGPTFRLSVGDTVVVRLINDLPYATGIHWHGVELENYADGTEVTQDGAPGAPLQVLGNGAPAGGTFLYKFKVTRPGLFWYHPHHHNGLNQVFRGMYGLIIVTDPLEANLTDGVLPNGVILPSPADTMQVVLSDITVCKGVGSMDPTYLANYVDPEDAVLFPDPDDAPEWISGATSQLGPFPQFLCELPDATNDDGGAAAASYGAGDIPSLVRPVGRLTEGQTVLTNGVNVGGRLGKPGLPRAMVGGVPAPPAPKNVQSGQGLRLQIVNCATIRYFRLRLTYAGPGGGGVQVPLVRVGGEGGLLDNAILEGGNIGTISSGFDTGEILLTPASRADVVVAIPAFLPDGITPLPVGTVLTLWTRDYQRTGFKNPGNWAQLPSVPVMHLTVTGPKPGAAYTIVGRDDNAAPPVAGTALRAPAGMPAVDTHTLGASIGSLLDPMTIGKTGNPSPNIQITTINFGPASIDGVPGNLTGSPHYTDALHIGSSRYASQSTGLQTTLLELTVGNSSTAHHPFHLHGFSFQPKRLEQSGLPVYTWPYQEFRDSIDVPPGTTLRFMVRLDDRELADGVAPAAGTTAGGALGRWMFHCHIFFHGHHGMMSELVVTTPDGREKPNINVGGSWAFANIPGMATRQGTFFSREGQLMTLTASKGTVNPAGPSPGGNWTWSFTSSMGDPDSNEYVYITATDSDGRKDQCVFRLQLGGTDLGSDTGDPHLRTVDGRRYDFQAAGEFILLRDRDGMEIQVRQTPAATPPPVTDSYSGLTACVSLNTAIAARVGSHRIAFQPHRHQTRPEFLLDGKPSELPAQGLELDGHRVSTIDAGGQTGLRIDYAHGPVVTVTTHVWTSYGIHYLNVQVANTDANEGLMGRIINGTWLPALPSGATVGPRPASLHDRYVALYRTFADAWRVTDRTSMFTYSPYTSTKTFTDRNWPPEKPPCTKLSRQFLLPANPILENIPLDKAEQICKVVTDKDLHENCVFDVATTGDEEFAKSYLIAQELRHRGSLVQIVGSKPRTGAGEGLVVTATVMPLTPGRPAPKGTITFLIDEVAADKPIDLDKDGRALLKTQRLRPGIHRIRAVYTAGRGKDAYHDSSSPTLLHRVAEARAGIGPYQMRGLFYEACDCFTVCPCWIGHAPDGGECTGVFAWEIEAGSIDGIDVAGLLAVSVSSHGGPRDEAKQRVMIFIDDRATRVQADAMAAAFSGKLGGPLQELGDLLGDLIGVERAAIELRREGRLTTLSVEGRIRVEGTVREGPAGSMTLKDGKLARVLGSPAEIGESGHFRVALAAHSMDVDVRGRSTMSGRFSYAYEPEDEPAGGGGHGHRG